jgi:hypothetical protein
MLSQCPVNLTLPSKSNSNIDMPRGQRRAALLGLRLLATVF